MIPRVRAGLAGSLVVSAISSLTQIGSAQQPPPSVSFRADADVVEVDVRVFDRGGQFITGLTKEDFRILEDGRPQEVSTLTLVDIATDSRPAMRRLRARAAAAST